MTSKVRVRPAGLIAVGWLCLFDAGYVFGCSADEGTAGRTIPGGSAASAGQMQAAAGSTADTSSSAAGTTIGGGGTGGVPSTGAGQAGSATTGGAEVSGGGIAAVAGAGGSGNPGGGSPSGGTPGAGGASGTTAGAGAVSNGAGGADPTGGSANPGGGAPTGGSGGTAAGGASTGGPTPSSGCGMASSLTPAQWVEDSMMVEGVQRSWWTWLPNNYDPERAYPLVVLLHGCGDENNNVPIQRVSGDNAVLVKGLAVSMTQDGICWDTSNGSPNITFFEQMVSTAAERLCIDTSRVFAAGYSSGSWLINLLECVRGDLIRGAATVAGGTPFANNCMGTVARMFIHDANDPNNNISGNITERDRLIELNGCDANQTMPYDPDPCVEYQGCDPANPVVWCETSGRGHDRQDNLAPDAMWGFFSSL